MDDSSRKSIRWEVTRGRPALELLTSEWNALAHAGTASPTADATWMSSFCSAFDIDENVISAHALRQGDQLLAALVLRKQDRPISTWASISNAHTPHWAFAIDESRPEIAEWVIDHLLQDAVVIDFSHLLADGYLAGALCRAAKTGKRPFALEAELEEVWIDIRGSWEEVTLRLPAKMRRETRRKLRQLEQRGHLELVIVRGGEGLRPLLEECYDLESRTWKGDAGSAIKANPRTIRFYTDLAEAEAEAGRFALYLLRLDKKLIAFEYSIRAQGRIDMLKPSFDPAFSKFSPGNVLRYKLLEREVELGEIASYHLGRASEWKRLWVTNTSDLCRLRIYAHSIRGRLVHGAGPVLRGTLRKSRFLRKLVNRVRSLRS